MNSEPSQLLKTVSPLSLTALIGEAAIGFDRCRGANLLMHGHIEVRSNLGLKAKYDLGGGYRPMPSDDVPHNSRVRGPRSAFSITSSELAVMATAAPKGDNRPKAARGRTTML